MKTRAEITARIEFLRDVADTVTDPVVISRLQAKIQALRWVLGVED